MPNASLLSLATNVIAKLVTGVKLAVWTATCATIDYVPGMEDVFRSTIRRLGVFVMTILLVGKILIKKNLIMYLVKAAISNQRQMVRFMKHLTDAADLISFYCTFKTQRRFCPTELTTSQCLTPLKVPNPSFYHI
jgi:hypothetical protein